MKAGYGGILLWSLLSKIETGGSHFKVTLNYTARLFSINKTEQQLPKKKLEKDTVHISNPGGVAISMSNVPQGHGN